MAIISGNTYNHFISNYIAQEKTQSDTHKKSELRNVYKSIQKMNKENPLFLINQDDSDSQHDAVEIKEQAHSLQS
ncbi:MAG: flagellar capping protein, partial [Butyrivibrio sp.]|nr:flagellar capping protein [Butyrivibrio sp.]